MKIFMLAITLIFFALIGCESSPERENEVVSDEMEQNTTEMEQNTTEVEQNRTYISPLDDDITLGDFTVIEGFHGFPGDRSEILSIEEASIIGGTYILDVFNENLDGMYMEMTFNYNPHISHSRWIGTIAPSPEDFGDEDEGFVPGLIMFTLDAMTGERLSISNHDVEFIHETINSLEEFEELFSEPDDDELEIMIATAHHYAQRHFDHEIAINITLGIYYNGVTDSAYFPSETLTFVAADDEGRAIEISIQRESMQLISISTPLEMFDQ